MDVGCEYVESYAATEGVRRSVFREGLDEHKQCADSVVSREKGSEYLAKSLCKSRTEHRAAFLKTCRYVQHGVFEHGHKEREHMKAHHKHKSAETEDSLRP